MFIVSVLVLTKGLHYVACGKKESGHPSESLVKSKKVLKVKFNSLVGGTENCEPFSNSKVCFCNCVQFRSIYFLLSKLQSCHLIIEVNSYKEEFFKMEVNYSPLFYSDYNCLLYFEH